MSTGFYNSFFPLIDYSQLLTAEFNLQKPYNILNHVVSKQTINIQLNNDFIKSICDEYTLNIFNGKIKIDPEDQFINQPDPNNDYDTIQFFGSYNKFKISPEFVSYYKKHNIQKSYITVYAIQKANVIPPIISHCNKNVDLNINLNLDIPKTIKYSYFKQPKYYILDNAQTGFQQNIYVLTTNMPYNYYKNALTITDQQCCYDINKKQFWFASSNIQHYQSLLTDIATNGLYNPIPLRINQYGQIISTEDTRTRTLIALQLKLPYIPVIIYMSTYNNIQNNAYLKVKDLRKEANQLFNPYLIFN